MPNRILDQSELANANALLSDIRDRLATLAGGDPALLFAYRRKVAKMLTYDERNGPMVRRKLKVAQRKAQNGLCAVCATSLPEKYAVLDRFTAAAGYTPENTRLICEACDRQVQADRRYT